MHKVTHEIVCDVCGEVIIINGNGAVMYSFLKIKNNYDVPTFSSVPDICKIMGENIISKHTCLECSNKIEAYIKSIHIDKEKCDRIVKNLEAL